MVLVAFTEYAGGPSALQGGVVFFVVKCGLPRCCPTQYDQKHIRLEPYAMGRWKTALDG